MTESPPSPALPYAGDLSPRETWDRMAATPSAKLVDVRTQAEWTFVGVPDLSGLARQPILLSWQVFPTMARNEAFAQQLQAQGIGKDDPLYFLCRSGARSRAAAEFMTALGYRFCYNIADGFEGPADGDRHRGRTAGWKASDLPWVQG
jgi:rhodanese-related sulfurtransferase